MQDEAKRLRRVPALRFKPVADGSDPIAPFGYPNGRRPLRWLRVLRKTAALALWTLLAMPVQAVLLALPGRGKVVFARVYWAVVARLLGIRVRIVGHPVHAPGRTVVFAANHSSWLDIPVLGGRLEACFVSKEEVARWPVIRTVARLGRTAYVSRRAAATGRERDGLRGRLDAGDNLLLFPEGTSSDGSRVLSFRTSFFAIADRGAADSSTTERGTTERGENSTLPPLIQPVSVVYDRLAGLPAGRASRPVFAWYGAMELGSHYWRLAQWTGMRATILLHPPLDPAAFRDRKALAQHCWSAVADGAALLRQNRPVPAAAATPPVARPGLPASA